MYTVQEHQSAASSKLLSSKTNGILEFWRSGEYSGEQMRGAEDAAEQAEANVARLEKEVEVVRAREEALKGVVERMIERYGAWMAYERRAEQ